MRSRIRNSVLLLLTAMLMGGTAEAQEPLPPTLELPQYSFVRYEKNHLHYDTSSASFGKFLQKFRRVTATGEGNINIVHIGSSHVQAGTLTNRVRTNLYAAYPHLVGSRGMLFPYSAAAKCNNPADYKVHCREKVALTRNVYREPSHELGLCGIAITASDTLTTVQMLLKEPRYDYHTSQIVLYGESPDRVIPYLRIGGRDIRPSHIDPPTRRYLYDLATEVDSFDIVLPCQTGQSFTLTGVCLNSRHDGITYHSIGVNGAAVLDYLKCSYLTSDLRQLKPDLVVFGIGINDAAGPHFDSVAFKENYLRLVDSIRSVNPDVAIIFLTNNDSYRRTGHKGYAVNKNGLQARDVFYRLAELTGGAVWDQFEVMGGLGSMAQWQSKGLAQHDKVHFTVSGYQLVGDLFTNALFEALRNNSNPSKTQTLR